MTVGWPSLFSGWPQDPRSLWQCGHEGSEMGFPVCRMCSRKAFYFMHSSTLLLYRTGAGKEEEEGQVLSHFSASGDRPVDTHA